MTEYPPGDYSLPHIANGGARIQHAEFTHANLLGPAVVIPGDGTVFDGCTVIGVHDSIFWNPPGQNPSGAIYLDGCKFKNCTFANVGFAGEPARVACVREGLRINQAAVNEGRS